VCGFIECEQCPAEAARTRGIKSSRLTEEGQARSSRRVGLGVALFRRVCRKSLSNCSSLESKILSAINRSSSRSQSSRGITDVTPFGQRSRRRCRPRSVLRRPGHAAFHEPEMETRRHPPSLVAKSERTVRA
jgi:hypothetical protein